MQAPGGLSAINHVRVHYLLTTRTGLQGFLNTKTIPMYLVTSDAAAAHLNDDVGEGGGAGDHSAGGVGTPMQPGASTRPPTHQRASSRQSGHGNGSRLGEDGDEEAGVSTNLLGPQDNKFAVRRRPAPRNL